MLFLSPEITIYCLALAAVFGAAMASFLNCMAWRIVHGESVLKGRSHCDACGHALGAADLLPIVSYLLRKGKCRYCGAKLSLRHLLYECLGAVLFVSLLIQYDITAEFAEFVGFACVLMGAAFADIEGFIIPNRFLLAGVVWRIVFLPFSGAVLPELADALIGGFGIALVLLGIVLVTEKLLGREAMGGGDIKLIFMIGLFLGWKRNLLSLFIACILGIFTGFITKNRRESDENQEDKRIFPWGPSLSAAACLTLFFGNELIHAYLSLF